MAFTLGWRSDQARHTDQLVARRLNLWRDILPYELEPELMDKPVGHVARRVFAPGELIVPYQADLCFNLSQRLPPRPAARPTRRAARGRFYPGPSSADRAASFPTRCCRSGSAREQGHALLRPEQPPRGQAARARARASSISGPSGHEHPRRCNDVAEMVTGNGPGMQARWRGQATDFWADRPFARADEAPDAAFFAHVAHGLARRPHGLARDRPPVPRLLPAGGRVLDLLASWESHLPAGTRARQRRRARPERRGAGRQPAVRRAPGARPEPASRACRSATPSSTP
jgi:hypothetical protein